MKINIRGGTRSTTQRTLCESCTRATVAQGMSQRERLIHCNEFSTCVPFNVETCSSYHGFGVPTLYEMKEIASVITLKGNLFGFFTPEQWKKKHGNDSVLPGEYQDD